MKAILRLLACATLFCAAGMVQGADAPSDFKQEFTAKVIAVLDGDTVLVLHNKRKIKIRLAEIDAPEVGHAGMGGMPPNSQKAQPFSETSRRSLAGMVLGKQVNISVQAVDKYGRLIAHLGSNGLSINAEQIRRGMAWEYSHFHSNAQLIALEAEARQVPRGLWALSNPVPPWEWRKLHPSDTDARPAPNCDSKKHCSEITSCEEARHYLTQCGIKTLDGNSDGVPCESLCGPDNRK